MTAPMVIVVMMDACASIARFDDLVSPELHEKLRYAFKKMTFKLSHTCDWRRKSKDIILGLVHLSIYPTIYGQSHLN